jgi:cytidylate kinase
LTRPGIIAIDGPAGSGKSTVSYKLAERYGYVFIDTGVFYRTMTLVGLRAGVPFTNAEALAALARNTRIQIVPTPHNPIYQYRVIAEGEDVTGQIRTPEIEANVSRLSAIGSVRQALVEQQRQAASQGNIIMAGRDIGTVVLPHADVKFYIDASLAERANRRYLQQQQDGHIMGLAAIEEALRQRDKEDSEREVSPLRRADDAIYIFTDNKSIDQVVDELTERLEAWEPA